MNRSRSTIYRICLLAEIVLTIAGGIFYYVNVVEKKTTVTEGTLVWNVEAKEETAEESQALDSSPKSQSSPALENAEESKAAENLKEAKESQEIENLGNGLEAESPEDGAVTQSFRPFGAAGKQA